METLFAICKHFGDFVKCIFTLLLQIQHENNFLPTTKHRQDRVRRFPGICLYDCFIYRLNFVFQKCLERRRHLDSGRQSEKPRILRVTGAKDNARKLLFSDLVNT